MSDAAFNSYRETVRQVSAAREKRLAELVIENAQLRAEIAALHDPAQTVTAPRLTDNDAGEISVTHNGQELRGWSYKDDAERRVKMLAAREYVEGWCARGDRHDGHN